MIYRNDKKRIRQKESGFVLVTMALAGIAVLGCLGLSVDVARMYVAKNEAQAYADAAALAGALKLDGTPAGVTIAQTTALGLADKWNFMTSAYSGTTVEVAKLVGGPWVSANTPPNPATNYTFIRVNATVPVSLYFVPIVTGGGFTGTVNASAVARQAKEITSNEGLFPFSPIAFDGATNTGGAQTESPWGFVAGTQYTMRYPSSSGATPSQCAGDAVDSNHEKVGAAVGFWGDNSASVVGAQVRGDLQEVSLTIGNPLPGVGGAKTTIASFIDDRIAQDGDTTDNIYSDYLANPAHNGRRVIAMPLQSEVDGSVLGFGSFLLLDSSNYGHSGNSIWCAVFIGPAVIDSAGPSANPEVGIYQVRLVQ